MMRLILKLINQKKKKKSKITKNLGDLTVEERKGFKIL